MMRVGQGVQHLRYPKKDEENVSPSNNLDNATVKSEAGLAAVLYHLVITKKKMKLKYILWAIEAGLVIRGVAKLVSEARKKASS